MPDSAEWDKINEKKRQDILWSQSFNLAAAMTAPIVAEALKRDKAQAIKDTLKAWQNFFFTELNQRYEKIPDETPFDPDVF